MKRTPFFSLALATFLPFFGQAQSGWTRPKNAFFAKIDIAHGSSKNYWNLGGDLLKTNRFDQSSLSFYAEYGLRDRLTLIAQGPLLRRNAFETTRGAWGQGDLRLEAKFRLSKKPAFPVAFSLAPELPTGRRNALAQNKNSPLERINLPTGDGEWNVWATLAASHSFRKTYVSAFAAFDFRTKYDGLAFRDLYQIGAEFGYRAAPKLWLIAKTRAQKSVGPSRFAALGFVRGDGSEFLAASAEAFFKMNKNYGLSAAFSRGLPSVFPFRNIYAGSAFSVGFVYERAN